jgi:hypothetical protein
VTGKASVASITVAVAFPISVALAGHPWGDVTIIAVMALVVIGRHLSNLRRLVRGEEPGLSSELDPPLDAPLDADEEPPDLGDERAAG